MLYELVDIIIYIFLAIGVFFNLLAGVGLLRFPDVYTRLWILGNADGSMWVIHTGIALVAILLTNPTGAHALARAAHRSGVKPVGAVIDELENKPTKKSASKKEVKIND